MDNRATRERSLHVAFVLTPDLLKRLATVLGEASKNVEYTVKFEDGTSVDYRDVDEILEQTNSTRRWIVSIIAGSQGEGIPSAYVVLKSAGDSPTVEYTVSGPQRNVIYFADQLDDWIAAIRQWYSPFLSQAGGFFLLFVAIFLPIYAWRHTAQLIFGEAVRDAKSQSWIQSVSIVGLWFVEYWIFRLFPRGTFAIGRGATHHQLLTTVRWVVVVGLIVSFVGSVVANLVTKRF
jgi:hypothetical protein